MECLYNSFTTLKVTEVSRIKRNELFRITGIFGLEIISCSTEETKKLEKELTKMTNNGNFTEYIKLTKEILKQ